MYAHSFVRVVAVTIWALLLSACYHILAIPLMPVDQYIRDQRREAKEKSIKKVDDYENKRVENLIACGEQTELQCIEVLNSKGKISVEHLIVEGFRDQAYLDRIQQSLRKLVNTSDFEWSQKSQGAKWMYVTQGSRIPETNFMRFRVYKYADVWKESFKTGNLIAQSDQIGVLHRMTIPEWDLEVTSPSDIEERAQFEQATSLLVARLKKVIK